VWAEGTHWLVAEPRDKGGRGEACGCRFDLPWWWAPLEQRAEPEAEAERQAERWTPEERDRWNQGRWNEADASRRCGAEGGAGAGSGQGPRAAILQKVAANNGPRREAVQVGRRFGSNGYEGPAEEQTDIARQATAEAFNIGTRVAAIHQVGRASPIDGAFMDGLLRAAGDPETCVGG